MYDPQNVNNNNTRGGMVMAATVLIITIDDDAAALFRPGRPLARSAAGVGSKEDAGALGPGSFIGYDT